MTENKPKSEINLRKLMQKLGLGTNAFAEKCGMSSQSMSQFLRNKSLTTNTIYRIAVALDIDPRDMFFPTDETISEKEIQERTTLGAPNWNVLTDKNHRLDYSNGALDPVFAELSGGGELLKKRLKNLEAEKENGQEDAQQEGTQKEAVLHGNIQGGDIQQVTFQSESTQTAIQTSTFCPHCGKKVRVGVVLLPEK